MTRYLLDANVLIRAHADYYPIDRIPAFWSWLLDQALEEVLALPRDIYDEVAKSRDLLGQWLRQPQVRRAVILNAATDQRHVQAVISAGYAPDLDDIEIMKVGKDPFLIAAAIGHDDRVVVTREVSKPSATRANRKVPDVCEAFGIRCISEAVSKRVRYDRLEG